MPDHEYEFSVWAKGYVPKGVQRLSLPEGAATELTLVLRKKPTAPAVGELAPPFAVVTTDGRLLGLGDVRGKLLLLHVWCPYHRGDRDLPRFDTIRKRYGNDRLAMLGLSLSADVQESREAIEGRNIASAQAILRDRGTDPMMQEYDVQRPPNSYLIGPDSTILAGGPGRREGRGGGCRALGEK
jgi:hypothetical protein